MHKKKSWGLGQGNMSGPMFCPHNTQSDVYKKPKSGSQVSPAGLFIHASREMGLKDSRHFNIKAVRGFYNQLLNNETLQIPEREYHAGGD